MCGALPNSQCKTVDPIRNVELCQCNDDFVEDGNFCIAGPGADCSSGASVCDSAPNLECSNGACECKTGFREVGSSCTAILGADCSSNAAMCGALPYSQCKTVDSSTAECRCNDGFVEDGNNIFCIKA